MTNDGTGKFNAPVQYPAGDRFHRLNYGDINADGFGDIVALSKFDHTINILYGNAGDTFQLPVELPYDGKDFSSLVLEDFDSDGHLDIAAYYSSQNPTGTFIDVLINQLDGNFIIDTTISTSGNCNPLVVEHLNDDDNYDFACLSPLNGTISFLFSNTEGDYSTETQIETPQNGTWFDIFDIDGDDHVDTVTSGINVWRGNTTGQFTTKEFYPIYGEGTTNGRGDLNGDGFIDFVLFDNETIYVVFGRYGGSLNAQMAIPLPEQYFQFTTFDLFNDGIADIAFPNPESNSLDIYVGNKDTIDFSQHLAIPTGDTPGLVQKVRFNADDVDDFFVYNAGSNTISIILGAGNGTFLMQKTTQVPTYPNAVSFADIDGDQIKDVSIYSGPEEITLFKGMPNGELVEITSLDICANQMELVDVNLDGYLDIVTACGSTHQIEIFLGNENGGYESASVIQAGFSGTPKFGLMDIDGDDDLDLITSRIKVYLNHNGTFDGPVQQKATQNSESGIKFHDMNNDSLQDVVSGNISVFINDHHAYLQDEMLFRSLPTSVFELADVNSDSLTDIVSLYNDFGDSYFLITLNNFNTDPDGDSVPTAVEGETCMRPWDSDTDDDGIPDGAEDKNANGIVDVGETDPCNADTDSDGVLDGTELGYTNGATDPDGDGPLAGTDVFVFIADSDPNSVSNATTDDTDSDGLLDGQEDQNANGARDSNETDINNPDTDGDGLEDGIDTAPLDSSISGIEVKSIPAVPVILLTSLFFLILARSIHRLSRMAQ